MATKKIVSKRVVEDIHATTEGLRPINSDSEVFELSSKQIEAYNAQSQFVLYGGAKGVVNLGSYASGYLLSALLYLKTKYSSAADDLLTSQTQPLKHGRRSFQRKPIVSTSRKRKSISTMVQ